MPLFFGIVAAFLAFMIVAFVEPLQFSYMAWLPEYAEPAHRVHHVMIGSLLALLVIATAVQLYRPRERVGAYLLAVVGIAMLAVATVVGDGIGAVADLAVFIVPIAVIGFLHPGLREFRPSLASIDRWMLGVALIGALPLIAFAAYQLNLQLTVADHHIAFGHYVMMAGGALTIGIGAIIASMRPAGWRLLAYGVAALVVLVGVASIAFPGAEQGTNFGLIGGILAVIWGVGLVAVGEYRDRLTSDPDHPAAN